MRTLRKEKVRLKKFIKYILVITCFLFLGVLYSCSQNKDKAVIQNDVDATSYEETMYTKEDTLYVHVTGYVKNPGVYEVQIGIRLYQVVELAGGFLEEADTEYINLAEQVIDGMQIRIYSKDETADLPIQIGNSEASALVNINTASKEMLMTLPGIGESKAESIIKYRETKGNFKSLEDLMNVSGIKQGAFDKVKDFITL